MCLLFTFYRQNELQIYRCDWGPQCRPPGPELKPQSQLGPERGGEKSTYWQSVLHRGSDITELSLNSLQTAGPSGWCGEEEITAVTKGWWRRVQMQLLSVLVLSLTREWATVLTLVTMVQIKKDRTAGAVCWCYRAPVWHSSTVWWRTPT